MWSYTWSCVVLIYLSVISEFVQSAYNNGSSDQELVSSRTHTDVGPNHRTKVTSTVYRSNHGISYHQVIDQQQHVRGGTHTNNGNTKWFGRSEQNDLPSQQHVYAQKHEVSHSDMNVSHQHHSSNVRVPNTSLNLEKFFNKEQANFPSQQHIYRMRDSQKHQRHVRHVKHSTNNRNTEELIRNEQNLPSRHNHHNGHRVSAPQGNQTAQHSGRVRHSSNSDNTEFIQNEQHSSSAQHNHQSGLGASHPHHQHHGSDAHHSTNTEFINNEQNSHHNSRGASHPQGHQHHGSNARQPTDENTKLIKNEQDSSSHQHNHRGNPQGVAHHPGATHPHGAAHPQGIAHHPGAAHPHQQHQGGNATGYENAADFIKNERLVESPDSKDKKQERGRMTLTVTPISTEPPKFLPKTEIVITSPVRSCPTGTMRDWSGRCRDLFN